MEKIPLVLLEALLAVAEGKNLEAAADHLGITQPALSKQLQRLESILPEPLFFLRGRRKELTAFGRGLSARLRTNLGQVQETVEEYLALGGSDRGARLRIVARGGVLRRLTTVPFAGTLTFREAAHSEILEQVLSLKADLGITHVVPSTHELVAKPLFTETFRLVVPKVFSARRPKPGSLGFLSEVPVLAYREQDELIEGFAREYNLTPPRPRRIFSDYDALATMAERGLGWALLPSYVQVDGTWALDLPRSLALQRRFSVIYRPEFRNVAWFKEFLAEVLRRFPAT